MRIRSRLVVCSSNSVSFFFSEKQKSDPRTHTKLHETEALVRVISCEFVDRIAFPEHSTSIFGNLLELFAIVGLSLIQLRVPSPCIGQPSSLRSRQKV